MKIIFLSPGTGSYYCGACMRDNALARELIKAGHEVTIVPMYLPLVLDETAVPGLEDTPVFFGGINVYLQQKTALFRNTPAFVDRMLNNTGLLRWAARHSHMTTANELADLTLEMLNVSTGVLRKELDKLLKWLQIVGKPDLVCLSNALLAGLASTIKRRLGVPVVMFFQGEDSFLDSLPQPKRDVCWGALVNQLPAMDAMISPSRFYAEFMRGKLGLGRGEIKVVHNGIDLSGYFPAPQKPATHTIGYLARMCPDKGLQTVIDAFVLMNTERKDLDTRLRIAGTVTEADQDFIASLKERIADYGLESRVEWLPNLTRQQKTEFLRSLTLFSVPALYTEAFGLYVIEAMACGVPVVQPMTSSFPELIEMTGGGILVQPRKSAMLADGWMRLLDDPEERAKLAQNGRLGVEKRFSARTMAEQFCRIADRLVQAPAG